MSKATIRNYGTVDFDPISPSSNFYDLYNVAIVDPETDLIVGEEHYVSEEDYRSALRDVYGREIVHEDESMGFCDVIDGWGEGFECECTKHVAYVIDHEVD